MPCFTCSIAVCCCGRLPQHICQASRPSTHDGHTAPPKKSTRYCECFASGRYCDGCNCVGCCNNQQNEGVRQSAVEAILDRNPNAFRPKIAGDVVGFWRGEGG